MRTIRASINRIALEEKLPKADWPAYAKCWEVMELTPHEMFDKVCRGHSFGPVFEGLDRGIYPCYDTYIESHTLVADIDSGDYFLEELMQNPLVQAHGAFIYPTMSSKPGDQRHRVVFILDEPITDVQEHKRFAAAIGNLFGGSDPNAASAHMTFYGNGRIHFEYAWHQTYCASEFSLSRLDLRIYAKQQELEYLKRQQEKVREWRKDNAHREYQEGQMTLQELAAKLNCIDPYSLDRDEWVKLGAAIAHTYGEEAYPLFKQWSDREGHAPMPRSEWNSMLREGSAGYGSIIHILHRERAL